MLWWQMWELPEYYHGVGPIVLHFVLLHCKNSCYFGTRACVGVYYGGK
jgi:hypothetical protein